MSVRKILLHPDPRLKKVCAPFDDVNDALRELANDLLDTMYNAPGVGLAAPQIGVLERIFVMDCTDSDSPRDPIVAINPEIIAQCDEINTHAEGCLSLPDLYEDIDRPAQITMRFLDRDGTEQTRDFEGLWATCAQHELDHLNGKLFIDHLSRMKRAILTKKMIKYKKDHAADGG